MNIVDIAPSKVVYLKDSLIDAEKLVICGSDQSQIHLEPRLMNLLQALLQAKGEVLSRQQLIDRVWGSSVVSDENLTQAISQLRSKLKAANISARIITVPKMGYRMESDPNTKLTKQQSPTPKQLRIYQGLLITLILSLIVIVTMMTTQVEIIEIELR